MGCATRQRPSSNVAPPTSTASENEFLAQDAPRGHLTSSPEPESVQRVVIEIEVKVKHSVRKRAPEGVPMICFPVIIMLTSSSHARLILPP